MGRASRAKRVRRDSGWQRPDRAYARLDRHSALRVLSAASVSPTAAHRQPTLAAATVACWQRMKLATLEVRADDLPLLLGPGEDRRHASLEADEPLDVRLGTRVRWGRALYRVAPGGWERPISIIEEARFRAGFVAMTISIALRNTWP